MLSVYGVVFHLFQEILTKKTKWLRLRWLRQRLAEAETETSHSKTLCSKKSSVQVCCSHNVNVYVNSNSGILPHYVLLQNTDCYNYVVKYVLMTPVNIDSRSEDGMTPHYWNRRRGSTFCFFSRRECT